MPSLKRSRTSRRSRSQRRSHSLRRSRSQRRSRSHRRSLRGGSTENSLRHGSPSMSGGRRSRRRRASRSRRTRHRSVRHSRRRGRRGGFVEVLNEAATPLVLSYMQKRAQRRMRK